jgi:uncharacterized RDD family membrane protein YckC
MSTNSPAPNGLVNSFSNKLTIETPEQIGLDFAIAGVGSRFLALALDMLIQAGIGLVVGIGGGIGMAMMARRMPKSSIWGVAILLVFFFLLYFGYFAFFEIIWNGQTPGKRRTGIRVIKDSGRPLTPAESIGRNLMRIVDWMPSLYAVGIVSALMTKENKRLGDLVVGSLVVRESSLRELKPTWQPAQPSTLAVGAPIGSAHLSVEEFALVESFLHRRLELEPNVRFRMADEIVRRLKPNLTLPAENTSSSEKILEALAYERRATSRYS